MKRSLEHGDLKGNRSIGCVVVEAERSPKTVAVEMRNNVNRPRRIKSALLRLLSPHTLLASEDQGPSRWAEKGNGQTDYCI